MKHVALLLLAGFVPLAAWADPPTDAPPPAAVAAGAAVSPAPVADPAVDTNAPTRDMAAARYLNACAGCHSLTGVKLNGPALNHVIAWPPEQLGPAIKRMEKNVGPLTDEDIAGLVALLRAPDLASRLQVEGERIRAQFAAKLAPADPHLGQALFYGRARLQHGGLACAACHRASGVGGVLGPDLTDAHGRLGEAPLISAIEKSAFKVMAPHYRRHPVTAQEALHLTAFLGTLQPGAAPAAAPDFVMAGAGGAALLFAALALYYARHRTGRRERLQRRTRG